jgi:hypothetical protein
MATISREITVQFQTTREGDIEPTHFRVGDQVSLVQEWDRFYLIKDADGHFYNVPKDSLDPS